MAFETKKFLEWAKKQTIAYKYDVYTKLKECDAPEHCINQFLSVDEYRWYGAEIVSWFKYYLKENL